MQEVARTEGVGQQTHRKRHFGCGSLVFMSSNVISPVCNGSIAYGLGCFRMVMVLPEMHVADKEEVEGLVEERKGRWCRTLATSGWVCGVHRLVWVWMYSCLGREFLTFG